MMYATVPSEVELVSYVGDGQLAVVIEQAASVLGADVFGRLYF